MRKMSGFPGCRPLRANPLKFFVVLFAALLLFAGCVDAEDTAPGPMPDPPVFWLLQPALDGAEELLLSCAPFPGSLRVNLFSGEEPLAASASLSSGLPEAGIRIRLLRPLRDGETLTFYADGDVADGHPFSLQLSFDATMTAELDLQLEAAEKLMDGYDLAGRGNPVRLPASLRPLGVLKSLLSFTPRLEKVSGGIRLDDPDMNWDSLTLYAHDTMVSVLKQDPGSLLFVADDPDMFSGGDWLELGHSLTDSLFSSRIDFRYDPRTLELLEVQCVVSLRSSRAWRMSIAIVPEGGDSSFQTTFTPENSPALNVWYDADGQITAIFAAAPYAPEPDGAKPCFCDPVNRDHLKGVEWIP